MKKKKVKSNGSTKQSRSSGKTKTINLTTLLIVSIFFGWSGIDRFMVGQSGLGFLKLITFGGYGVWWAIDVISIATKRIKGVKYIKVKLKAKGEREPSIKSQIENYKGIFPSVIEDQYPSITKFWNEQLQKFKKSVEEKNFKNFKELVNWYADAKHGGFHFGEEYEREFENYISEGDRVFKELKHKLLYKKFLKEKN